MFDLNYTDFCQNYKSKFHNGKNTNTFVKYKVISKNNDIAIDHGLGIGKACYSAVTYSKIPNTWEKLETWFDLSKLPYSKTKIIKWIKELNELGFPCYLDFDNKNSPGTANITVKFSDFTRQLHLNSTLQLIRALWESGINHVPDIYFQLSNKFKNSDLNDRFLLLQHSHNLLTYTKDTTGYYNYNHTITYYNNGVKDQAISLKTYNQRLKNSISMDISFGSVNDLWKRNLLVNKDIKI